MKTDITHRRGSQSIDVLAEVRRKYTITHLWRMLGLPGPVPRPGEEFSSPFQLGESPPCYISENGRWFVDSGSDDIHDGVVFVWRAFGGNWGETRAWLLERVGIDKLDGPVPASGGRCRDTARLQDPAPSCLIEPARTQ